MDLVDELSLVKATCKVYSQILRDQLRSLTVCLGCKFDGNLFGEP
jgi:hypothetical protein